jgi:hypothetical protein
LLRRRISSCVASQLPWPTFCESGDREPQLASTPTARDVEIQSRQPAAIRDTAILIIYTRAGICIANFNS